MFRCCCGFVVLFAFLFCMLCLLVNFNVCLLFFGLGGFVVVCVCVRACVRACVCVCVLGNCEEWIIQCALK